MRVVHLAITSASALITIGSGLLLTPSIFAGRVVPGFVLGDQPLVGVPEAALNGVVFHYEQNVLEEPVHVVVRNKEVTRSLRSLGVTVKQSETTAAIRAHNSRSRGLKRQVVIPEFSLDQAAITLLVQEEFAAQISLPHNATLALSPTGLLTLVPSATGETIDLTTFGEDLKWRARHNDFTTPIELAVVSAPASVHEGETATAKELAEVLLTGGLPVSDGVTNWTIPPGTMARLIRFIPVSDPAKASNEILGVTVDPVEVTQYLVTTIAPEVNQIAIDARFERSGDHVTQFAVPQAGRALNVAASTTAIQQALLVNKRPALLVVDMTEPAVRDTADIDALGINHLLASGTSDFAGSPNNRIHNILEGTKRYHGLLVAPAQEFSFNEFLGPVDGAHGFKPELVIKNKRTIPEFGGGLCQVSTTLFRAATYSGLKITQRRNHAYAVRYYGVPGFDATIYPPYTDLRFTNNTPGYLLIQTRVEGTQLVFELWGTDDNRDVVVTGPTTFGRTPDGAVRATLTQKVTKNGELLIDDTFGSRYQSPNLFPKQPPHVSTQPPTPTPSPPPAPI